LNPARFGAGGTDPFWSSVRLLMHFNGANGSTTFTDNSSPAKTFTRSGDPSITTAQFKFGGASGTFDGDDFLVTSTAMSFGTGDFTVEAWLRFNSTADMALLAGLSNTEMDLAFVGNEVRIGRLNTAWDSAFSFTRSTGVWYHVAWCRSGTSMRAFVDGTQVGTTSTNSNAYNAATGFRVGASNTTTRRFSGWIDDLRVTVGVARYTANFTPPAAQFPDS
jgi:hypothetical protein